MSIKIRSFALRPLAIMLMLAMMAFASVADAATCGVEIGSPVAFEVLGSASALQVDADQRDHDAGGSPADKHGLCAHGHCHHGSNIAEAPRFERLAPQLAVHLPETQGEWPSANPDLLKRPPRA